MKTNVFIRKKSLKGQSPSLIDALDEPLKPARLVRPEPGMTLVTFIAGVAIGATLLAGMRACERLPQPAVKADCMGCHQKMAYEAYFKGSLDPQAMAAAVLATKSPRLLAAIHVAGEKRTPHTARNTGYRKQNSGAWQTAEIWGPITKHTTITEQALIAELAIETHVKEEGNIVRGINAYGGERDKKDGQYAYNVLEELARRTP